MKSNRFNSNDIHISGSLKNATKDQLYEEMAAKLAVVNAMKIAGLRSRFDSSDPDICYAEGFVQGLKHALHGMMEGEIEIKTISSEVDNGNQLL